MVKYRFGPGGADRLPGLRHRRKNRGMKTGLLALVLLAMCCRVGSRGRRQTIRQASRRGEKARGADSPYLLPLLEPLAQQRFPDGKLAEAGELRRRALKIALGAFGSESASAAEAMIALALSNIDRRRYLDAEPLLIAAAEALKERVDGDHPALANVFAGLARVALARGDADAALAWAEKAAAIAAKNPHQRATEPMLALAAALAAKERFTEAERTAREALARDRRRMVRRAARRRAACRSSPTFTFATSGTARPCRCSRRRRASTRRGSGRATRSSETICTMSVSCWMG